MTKSELYVRQLFLISSSSSCITLPLIQIRSIYGVNSAHAILGGQIFWIFLCFFLRARGRGLKTVIFNVRTIWMTSKTNKQLNYLDKHWLLRMPPSTLQNETIETLDDIYRKRWQSLLAVDDMIANIVQTLKDKHLYDNTYIIFTSDNGYHIGQFAQAFDKRQPYETDIRVPFVISGPQIPQKIVYDYPVALIDIFPSILTKAGEMKVSLWKSFHSTVSVCCNRFKGIPLPDFVDGQSFFNDRSSDVGTVLSSDCGNRQILIEYWGEGDSTTYNPQCKWHKGDRLSVSKMTNEKKNSLNFPSFVLAMHCRSWVSLSRRLEQYVHLHQTIIVAWK